MSIINEYRATEQAIKELQERLNALSQNEKLLVEMEFEEKLRALMGEYQKSLRDIIELLDPDHYKATRSSNPAPSTTSKRTRKTKRYTNPNTGDVIETKGGNHKTLKEWKQEWGHDAVESWSEILD